MSMDLNWIKNRQARPRSRLLLLVLGTSGSLLMLGGLMGAGASGSHVAAPTIHAQVTHSAAPAAAVAHARNPHLHGATIATTRAPAEAAHPEAVHAAVAVHGLHHASEVMLHHAWHHRWSYHSWATVHRGLGIVQGLVQDASGRPVPLAIVMLKHPKGHPFARVAMRHTTRTNANGVFVMVGVRAGRYRVVAQKTPTRGHVQLAVHTGAMSTAQIKI